MQHVQGNLEPDTISYCIVNGETFARVAANITQGEDMPEWDEYLFPLPPDVDPDELIENAETLDAAYTYERERASMTAQEWRADVDQHLLDLDELAVM